MKQYYIQETPVRYVMFDGNSDSDLEANEKDKSRDEVNNSLSMQGVGGIHGVGTINGCISNAYRIIIKGTFLSDGRYAKPYA
jgi:hypothetical protein